MTPEDRRRSARTGTLICLILVQTLGVLLLLLLLVPWAVGAMFTLISLGQDGSIPFWILAVWSYPLLLVGFSSAAWGLFAGERYPAAVIVSVLPPVPVAIVFTFAYVMEVAAAI